MKKWQGGGAPCTREPEYGEKNLGGEKTAKHAIAVHHPQSPPTNLEAAAVPGHTVRK